MSGPVCFTCAVGLTPGGNWFPSHARKNRRVCKPCYNEQQQRLKDADVARWKRVRREWSRDYRERNADRIRECERARQKARRTYYAAKVAERRARKVGNTLPTTDNREIQRVFDLAKTLKTITGATYHVDHLHPLAKGGAHHQDNLVAMRADFNLKKSDDLYPALIAFFSPNVANTCL